jgi:hypothetical protein
MLSLINGDFRTMDGVNGLFVYSFHNDDDQQGWTPVENFSFVNYSNGGAPDKEVLSSSVIENVKTTLKVCGWEGDGQLGAMMVPPFFAAQGDNFWFTVFHVKQVNNGTSWIASERPLSIESLDPEGK